MNSYAPPAVDLSAKILLVKSAPRLSRGRAFVAGASGIYSRSLKSQSDIDEALATESFQLIVNDARSHPDEPFFFVEKLRREPGAPPLLLLCPALQFDHVVEAIRHRVNDILPPPVDFKALHERAIELLKANLHGKIPELSTARWFEIARFLAEDPEDEADAHTSSRLGNPQSRAFASTAADPSQLTAALQLERQSLTAAQLAHDHLVNENGFLRRQLAQLASGETEIVSLRQRLAASEVALAEWKSHAAQLAGRETDLAAAEKEVALTRQQLAQERSALDAAEKKQREASRQRETAASEIAAAHSALNSGRRALAEEQQRVAAERNRLDSLWRDLDGRAAELLRQQNIHAAARAVEASRTPPLGSTAGVE